MNARHPTQNSNGSGQSIHDRVIAVLKGERPERVPFIDRLELWHKGRVRTNRLPPEYNGMSLTDIHRAVGIGQQKFVAPYGRRLHGVELIIRFEGQVLRHEQDPVIDHFPDVYDLVPDDRAGITTTEFRTAVGKITVEHVMLENMVADGTRSYMREHPIKEEADLKTIEYILERSRCVIHRDRCQRAAAEIGDIGFVVPVIERIPFQQLLIDFYGETELFFALHDSAESVKRLLVLLDHRIIETLHELASLDLPYVEFVDNLDAVMTDPDLFAEYCLPCYQRYTDILHGQGKKVGSHTDGNLNPLLGLLAQSGLDVCESFSPPPLTPCTLEEAWAAWTEGPIVWGGVPSPILEPKTSEVDFQEHIARLMHQVKDQPIILGVADMVVPVNEIERVRYIAEAVEQHVI